MTPTQATQEANRRGDPSFRERITSTTAITRVTTKRTAMICTDNKIVVSKTNLVMFWRRMMATAMAAKGMTNPRRSKLHESTRRRKNDPTPGATKAAKTDPVGPRPGSIASTEPSAVDDVSSPPNALARLGVARSLKSKRSGGNDTPPL